MRKYPNWKIHSVNEQSFAPFFEEMLLKIRKGMYQESQAVEFHGDLQFDNIIHHQDQFILIDLRESFGGQSNWGDLSYDLAKMYGGLLLNYSLIKENKFFYDEQNSNIKIKVEEAHWQRGAREEFRQYIDSHQLNFSYIKLLTSLIFLNMAPLHNYPFDKFLYAKSFLEFQNAKDHL